MAGRSGVIKFIVCGLLIFGLGVIALNFFPYNRRQTGVVTKKKDELYAPQRSSPNRIEADFQLNMKPETLTEKNSQITTSKVLIRKYKLSLNDDKNNDILVREAGKGYFHILLLHGQGSSSKIWEDTGTLQYLSKWGYRAFAIDIPSPKSNSFSGKDNQEAIQLLTQIIDALHLRNLVIISPSMSGRLTLPYMFELRDEQKLIQGFVPIAPVGTNHFSANDYKQLKIPTLIVHGENDAKFQSAFKNLQQIPGSEILLIKDAGHGSYFEKPMEFHNALRQFLYRIYRPIYKKRFNELNKKLSVSNTTKIQIKRTRKSHSKINPQL